MMTQGIYCYIDKKTNKVVYVGKDSYINKSMRHKAHYWKSLYNDQPINKILQNNLDRYEYRVLEEGNISQKILNGLEMSFIQKYNPKFNFTKGGDGTLGFKHSEETKNKISNSHKGKKLSLEHKEKISKANKGENNFFFGKHHSKESKKKISKANKGENHPFFGKHHSEESKKKISEANKRENHYLFGKHHSEESKKKISEGISKLRNISGYYRVSKHKCKDCKQGFFWEYRWMENKKRKALSSTDINKLKKKVKEKSLPWFKIEREEQNERV